MKAVVAIDSFKGCLTSHEANIAAERGIKSVYPDAEVIKIPIADGGEGTVVSLVDGLGGRLVERLVTGPLMKKVKAQYGILPDKTAIIEMSAAAGLTLINENERNPLKTTTYGVGELIIDALNNGCRDFVIGIGGSATNDGGIGMLQALGYRFYDKDNRELPGVGESLDKLYYINDENRLKRLDECRIEIACDVDNPLYGKRGAAYVYARQKGANDKMVEVLDQGLQNYALVVKRQYNIDIGSMSGAGAAGGLGGGFVGFLKAKLKPGVDIIFSKLELEKKAQNADIIITGEGKMDFQSVMGKAPMGVAKIGKRLGIPVIGIAGTVTEEAYQLHEYGITALFSILNAPLTLSEAMDNTRAKRLIEDNIREIFRLIKMKV